MSYRHYLILQVRRGMYRVTSFSRAQRSFGAPIVPAFLILIDIVVQLALTSTDR